MHTVYPFISLCLHHPQWILLTAMLCGITSVAALLLHRRFHVGPCQELERLRQLADGAFEGIVLCHDDQILDVNLAF